MPKGAFIQRVFWPSMCQCQQWTDTMRKHIPVQVLNGRDDVDVPIVGLLQRLDQVDALLGKHLLHQYRMQFSYLQTCIGIHFCAFLTSTTGSLSAVVEQLACKSLQLCIRIQQNGS